MFKKLTISTMALSFIVFAATNAYAEKKDVDLNVYSPVLASPLHYDVKTGDTLNLTIKNKSNNDITFTIPMLKNDVTVEKNSKTTIPVDFSNPPEETISFFIQQEGSNHKDGTFKVMDYTVPKLTSNVEGIDTSVLKDIINYSKTSKWEQKYSTREVVEEDVIIISEKDQPVNETIIIKEVKEEPKKEVKETPKTPKKKRFIRGYW